VVRGAALYGIEKARLKNYITAARCPYFCGIAQNLEEIRGMANDQYQDPVTGKTMGRSRLSWIVHRGDLVLPTLSECQETLLAFTFREQGEREFTIPVYRYLEDDDILPSRVKEDDIG
jgi:hypothetical protein